MSSSRPLPRSLPEAEGVRSSSILAFADALDRRIDEVHSFVLVRHGKVVAEAWWDPYSSERKHLLFSLTKSFTSTAVGLAVDEGKLSLDDPVVKFFPGVAPARPSRHLAALKVRHLLSMSTGRLTDSSDTAFRDPSGDWVKGFFARPWLQAPGEPFVYDTGASHVLGALVAQVTGQDLEAYLRPRLFDPLGIDGSLWETDPKGRRTGGFGLSLTTEAVAKFGQLYLQKGQWEGKALLSEAWVAQATSKQVFNDRFGPNPNPDWRQGYGFQFWQGRHGSYRGDGAFGQFCVVMPDQDAVLAVTGGMGDMQPLLDAVWTLLLPGFTPGPLAADPEGARTLGLRLANLKFSPVAGEPFSDLETSVSTRKFSMEANARGVREARFAFGQECLTLTLTDRRGEHRVEAGRGAWRGCSSDLLSEPFPGTQGCPTVPLVSSFAWTGPRTLTLKIRMIETPFVFTLFCAFEDGRLRIDGSVNVGFGPRDLPRLVGVGRRA